MVHDGDRDGREQNQTIRDRVQRGYDRLVDPFYATTRRAEASTGMLGVGMAGMGAIQADDAVLSMTRATEYIVLQAGGGIGGALCEVGVGRLITAGLFLAAVYLAYLTVADIVSAAAAGNSRSSGSQNQRRDSLKNAGAKGMGALIVAGMPTILAGLGFSLLDCVEAVDVFGGGAALLPLLPM